MTQELMLRRASLADIRAIAAIEKFSFPSPWSRWAFLAELGNTMSRTLVAGPAPPQSWQTWGYIIFWVVAEEMHILNLAVHPRHRRQGIARRLLKEALGQARALRAEVAWLEVRPSNSPALSLYESFGFEEVGKRTGYYQDTEEDALLLALYWTEEGTE
jgi:ribosomal-protein-alanine N-acetyltransferase